VHARLGGRERLEDRKCAIAHVRHQLRARDQPPNLANRTRVSMRMLAAPVMMICVVMSMFVHEPTVSMRAATAGARLREAHLDVVGVERTARDAPHVEPERNIEAGKVGFERALRKSEIEQRAEQHVARDAREGVEVQDPRSRIQVAVGAGPRLRRIPPQRATGTSRPLPGRALRGG
jgi:hypothetical protein